MSSTTKTPQRSSTIKVPITGGNLRNGHVYIREYLWFFPKSAIRGDRLDETDAQPCTLELDNFGAIETEIDAAKGIFRWRGWKKFFRQHSVADGDHLVFLRTERDRFSVKVEHEVLEGFEAATDQIIAETSPRPTTKRSTRRCNDLSGEEWLRYSLSLWSDIRKTAEEAAISHPAMFPTMLCERLIAMFLRRRGKHRVLDPFMGSGSTLLAARSLGKVGVGLEINESYIELAKWRLDDLHLFTKSARSYEIHQADARMLSAHVPARSIDLCITSPPYWDILTQRRTADYKEIRHYGNLDEDLATIADYQAFHDALATVFEQVVEVLRPGAYCVVVVMDLRKKNRFFPFHNDFANRIVELGFVYDDVIIWDRGQEYNNLRPLGYPAVFRINKIHEFILIFRKPDDAA